MQRRVLALAFAAALAPSVITAYPAQAAVPLCFGQPATIIGTPGPDVLVGLSGVSEVIYGGGGDDLIRGGAWGGEDAVPGAAPDLLCGGPGDDIVNGSPGNDKLSGGGGNDTLDGEFGDDILHGNVGNDYLRDHSYADMDAGDDIMRGGSGDDMITTAEGIDRAYGEAGNDTLTDLECSRSYLYGGPGSDSFHSVRSSVYDASCSTPDVIHGGDGVDSAEANAVDRVTAVEVVARVDEP